MDPFSSCVIQTPFKLRFVDQSNSLQLKKLGCFTPNLGEIVTSGFLRMIINSTLLQRISPFILDAGCFRNIQKKPNLPRFASLKCDKAPLFPLGSKSWLEEPWNSLILPEITPCMPKVGQSGKQWRRLGKRVGENDIFLSII